MGYPCMVRYEDLGMDTPVCGGFSLAYPTIRSPSLATGYSHGDSQRLLRWDFKRHYEALGGSPSSVT